MSTLEDFRDEVRGWLAEHLTGEFAVLVGAGGPGREHEHVELRKEWEQELGRDGWVGLGWPRDAGGGGGGGTRGAAVRPSRSRSSSTRSTPGPAARAG